MAQGVVSISALEQKSLFEGRTNQYAWLNKTDVSDEEYAIWI